MTGRADLRRPAISGAEHPLAHQDVEELVGQLVLRRRTAGLSQAEVADRVGTSQRTVSQWDNRAHDPKVGAAVVWGRAVGLRLVCVPAESLSSPGETTSPEGLDAGAPLRVGAEASRSGLH